MALSINSLYKVLLGEGGEDGGQQIDQDWKPAFPITGELDEVRQISTPHCP